MTSSQANAPPGAPRVVVGVKDSRAARWALAWAIGEARLREMSLLVVHVTPLPEQAVHGVAGGCGDIAPEVRARGAQFIRALLQEVAGGAPAGVEVLAASMVGDPGTALIRATCDDDILVIGRGARTGLSRLLNRSVRTHCERHAQGTLICVAPPPQAEPLEEPARERSLLRRWLSNRRRAGADPSREG
ncbi:MAG TPA: universal stress protein [Actinomadura sp.]|jgi:nucleotide-binding universal stress UspA family protein|nr:universal stress protein [Actinomadura sp.]